MSVSSHGGAHRSGKRVLIFFPRNPYPFKDGNLKRFEQVLRAFIDQGAHVYLLSSNFFKGPEWNDESVRALKAMGVCDVLVYRVAGFEARICSRFFNGRKGREKDLFYSKDLNPPFMKFWFLKNLFLIGPDVVFINYIWWSSLVRFTGVKETLKVIDMHDCVSAGRTMRVELNARFNKDLVTVDDFEKIPDSFFDENYWAQKRLFPDVREMRAYDKFDCTIAISAQERDLVRKYTSKTRAVLAPYAELSKPVKNRFGDFALFPAGRHLFNFHALLYFQKKIWPKLKKENPGFKLKVTGGLRGKVFETEGIEMLDPVPDMTPFYENCRFVICPVIAGTGQSVKTVEALARGLAVVATPFAAAESGLVHGENGYIAENAEEFAVLAGKLWNDRDLCRAMGEKAAEISNRNFEENPMRHLAKSILDGSLKDVK